MIQKFDAVLLDFDGTLVETEMLHYEAYNIALNKFFGDLVLPYSFVEYANLAHLDEAHGIFKTDLERRLPQIKTVDWKELYAAKNKAYLDLCAKGIELTVGTEQLLDELVQRRASTADDVFSAIVTNSPRVQVEKVAAVHKIFDRALPLRVCREDYQDPKPHPNCYIEATSQLLQQWRDSLGERPVASDFHVAGVEDTPKGLAALLAARAYFDQENNAQPKVHVHVFFVSSVEYTDLEGFLMRTLDNLGFKQCSLYYHRLNSLDELKLG